MNENDMELSKPLTITICGGGSLGTVCAGVFLNQQHTVNLLTGHPSKWSKKITVTDINGKVYQGEINRISSEASEVIPSADIILCCVPGYLIKETLLSIKPYVKKNQAVGAIVSSTGFFFQAHEIFSKDNAVFGFQRVPFIARYLEYGSTASLLGYKQSLKAVIENCDKSDDFKVTLEALFMTPIELLNNHYEVSLTNSNPILHTSRLYSLWHDYKGEERDEILKFYAEWDIKSSEILLEMDKEFMLLTKDLGISTTVIPSLLDYYESSDAESITEKIKSIPAFKDISAPMIKNENGWVPDFKSRYFTEDFPFGLYYIYMLGKERNIPMPTIEKVYKWGIGVLNQDT